MTNSAKEFSYNPPVEEAKSLLKKKSFYLYGFLNDLYGFLNAEGKEAFEKITAISQNTRDSIAYNFIADKIKELENLQNLHDAEVVNWEQFKRKLHKFTTSLIVNRDLFSDEQLLISMCNNPLQEYFLMNKEEQLFTHIAVSIDNIIMRYTKLATDAQHVKLVQDREGNYEYDETTRLPKGHAPLDYKIGIKLMQEIDHIQANKDWSVDAKYIQMQTVLLQALSEVNQAGSKVINSDMLELQEEIEKGLEQIKEEICANSKLKAHMEAEVNMKADTDVNEELESTAPKIEKKYRSLDSLTEDLLNPMHEFLDKEQSKANTVTTKSILNQLQSQLNTLSELFKDGGSIALFKNELQKYVISLEKSSGLFADQATADNIIKEYNDLYPQQKVLSSSKENLTDDKKLQWFKVTTVKAIQLEAMGEKLIKKLSKKKVGGPGKDLMSSIKEQTAGLTASNYAEVFANIKAMLQARANTEKNKVFQQNGKVNFSVLRNKVFSFFKPKTPEQIIAKIADKGLKKLSKLDPDLMSMKAAPFKSLS